MARGLGSLPKVSPASSASQNLRSSSFASHRHQPSDQRFHCNSSSVMPRSYPAPRKGAAIRFIGGKYVGRRGWIDSGREFGETKVPVIVVKGSEEKQTAVDFTNYELETAYNEPTNYEEAIFDQVGDIELAMNKLVKLLAECPAVENTGEGGKRLARIFLKRVGQAMKRQKNKGDKARWRFVVWPPRENEL